MRDFISKFSIYIFMIILGTLLVLIGETQVQTSSGIFLGGLGFIGVLTVLLFELPSYFKGKNTGRE